MMLTPTKVYFACILFLLGGWNTTFALEQEDRLPPSAWRFQYNFIQTPEITEAFGKSEDRVPLWHLMVRETDLQTKITGDLKRSEQRSEFLLEYGWSSRWLIGAKLPFHTRTQSSTLAIQSPSASESTLTQNLGTEEVSGLGDVVLKTAYDASASNTWHIRWGMLAQLATGQSGTSRGLEALALGERHPILSGFVHFNWYPLTHGLRNHFRFMLSNALSGKRETLTGEKVDYTGGNRADLWYGWTLERSNWFLGAELQRQQKDSSTLKTIQNNASWFYQVQAELGYGNLTDLEKSSLSFPWQIKLGHRNIVQGQNVPALESFSLTALLFF